MRGVCMCAWGDIALISPLKVFLFLLLLFLGESLLSDFSQFLFLRTIKFKGEFLLFTLFYFLLFYFYVVVIIVVVVVQTN
jgi:hypothetical protein